MKGGCTTKVRGDLIFSGLSHLTLVRISIPMCISMSQQFGITAIFFEISQPDGVEVHKALPLYLTGIDTLEDPMEAEYFQVPNDMVA